MDLVYSVAFFGLAVVGFILVLLGSRMPDQPSWLSEGVSADLVNVTIVGLLAFGAAFGIQFVLSVKETVIGLTEVALVAATLIACFVIIRLMAPRRRLAEYAAEYARRNAMNEPGLVNVSTTPSAVANDSSNKPTLPRAA